MQKDKTDWQETMASVVMLTALLSGMITFHFQDNNFPMNVRLPSLVYAVTLISGYLMYFSWLERKNRRKASAEPAFEIRFEASQDFLERSDRRRKIWLSILIVAFFMLLWKWSWFFVRTKHPDWRLMLASIALCADFILPVGIGLLLGLVSFGTPLQVCGFSGDKLLWLFRSGSVQETNLKPFDGWCTRKLKDGEPHKIELITLPHWTFKEWRAQWKNRLRPAEQRPERNRFLFPFIAANHHGFLIELSRRLPELRSDPTMLLARFLMAPVYLSFIVLMFWIMTFLPCWPANTWQGILALIVSFSYLIILLIVGALIDGTLKAKQYRQVMPDASTN